jgi:Tol biopolymer transport system component
VVAGLTGVAQYSVSDNGSLAYVVGPSLTSGRGDLALVDRHGRVQPLNLPPGLYESPRAAPDGSRIVFGTDDGKKAKAWTYNLSGEHGVQQLTSGGNNRFPIWTSDSRRIVFQSDRDGDHALFWQLADGTGGAERLTAPVSSEAHVPESWSPIADLLIFSVAANRAFSLRTLSLPGKTTAEYGEVHSQNPTGAVTFACAPRSLVASSLSAATHLRPFFQAQSSSTSPVAAAPSVSSTRQQ